MTGISDHAQDALGDLVYVEAPDLDSHITAGEQAGVVESVKTASDIHAPVSGVVVEINPDLEDDPDFINDDPYGKVGSIKSNRTIWQMLKSCFPIQNMKLVSKPV